jgi:ribosomal protein S27AE
MGETPRDDLPNPSGLPPKHLRPMLDRFKKGCDTCGEMMWRITASGKWSCGYCGNIFDAPAPDEASP